MKSGKDTLLLRDWVGILCLAVVLGGCAAGGDEGTPGKTGVLTYLDRYSNVNINGAYSVTLSPDGKHAYVAASDANAVAWFTRDSGTGALTYGERYSDANIGGARSVAVSPDGKHAYVAASGANAVAWFTRDSPTGGGTAMRMSKALGLLRFPPMASIPMLLQILQMRWPGSPATQLPGPSPTGGATAMRISRGVRVVVASNR